MVTKWAVKELLTAVKMNQMGIRRITVAEQVAILDADRLVGDTFYQDDNNALQVYQSGLGATFDFTQLSNFLFRDKTQIGIGAIKATIYDEQFVNTKGKMNTRVFMSVEYLPYVSLAGEVEVIITDGVGPISAKDIFTADPTPTIVYKTFELITTTFTLDDVLNMQVLAQNAEVQYVEFRGI